MEPATLKLQLHYYFEDKEKHSMDAFVRNDNERDVLAIIKQSIELLDREMRIEVVAPEEGGLIDKYILQGKTLEAVTVVLLGIGLYFQWKSYDSQTKLNESQIRVNASEERLNNLQIEALEEERARRKKELRKQLHILETDTSLSKKNSKTMIEEVSDKLVDTLSKDYRAIWHRSKFFDRSYKTTNRVDKITTQVLDINDKPVEKEKTAQRDDFKFFILKSNNIQPFIDKNALIEIISPVLTGNKKYTWRGLYKGEVIMFNMLDKLFIQKIQNGDVEFKHGTTIRCVLEQKRKIDDATGLIRVVSSNVLAVAPIDDDDKILTIPKTRKFLSQRGNQLQLGLTNKPRRK